MPSAAAKGRPERTSRQPPVARVLRPSRAPLAWVGAGIAATCAALACGSRSVAGLEGERDALDPPGLPPAPLRRPGRPGPPPLPPERPRSPPPASPEQRLDAARRSIALPATECGYTCAHLYSRCPLQYDADCSTACEVSGASAQFLRCCRARPLPQSRCEAEGAGGVGFALCEDDDVCRPLSPGSGPLMPPAPEEGARQDGEPPLDELAMARACRALCEGLGRQCGPEFHDPRCPDDCVEWGRRRSPEAFSQTLVCCAASRLTPARCDAEGLGGVGFEDCDDDGRCTITR